MLVKREQIIEKRIRAKTPTQPCSSEISAFGVYEVLGSRSHRLSVA